MTAPLISNVTLKEIQSRYAAKTEDETFNALIMGNFGSGKTNILQTCRMPLLLHSFDPGGSKTLKDAAEKRPNEILIDQRFEKEDPNKPTAWNLWKAELDKLIKNKVFDSLGTYAIDSFTLFSEAWSNNYASANSRPNNILQLQDYQVFRNTLRDKIKFLTAQNCDFIMTGHIALEKDEITGAMEAQLSTFKSLREYVPTLFDEIYVMRAKDTSDGVKYELATAPFERYKARTRLGNNKKFDRFEEPNILKLLKKAGLPEVRPSLANLEVKA